MSWSIGNSHQVLQDVRDDTRLGDEVSPFGSSPSSRSSGPATSAIFNAGGVIEKPSFVPHAYDGIGYVASTW